MRFALLFFVLLLVLFPENTQAENNISAVLSVNPVFQELTLKSQDERTEFFITLKNNTDQAVTLRPSVVDFGSLDESGGVAFLGQVSDLERKYSLASWMHPEKDVLSVESGETERLRMVVENRESLSPGGHYGAVLFRAGNDNETVSSENTIMIQQLLSVLVFVKKEGGEVYALKLKEKSWSENIFSIAQKMELRFQNAGNVHVVPRGTVVLTDPLGRVVQKGIINPESNILLPETLRVYPVSLQNLSFAFFPGQYTLTVAYRYDGKEDFIREESKSIFIPWAGGVILLLVGSFIFSLRLFLRKRLLWGIKK